MTPTEWIMASTVVLLVGYDIFAVLKWGRKGTISFQLTTLSQRWIIIPFAIGILCGHFFWPQKNLLTICVSYLIKIGVLPT